MTGVSVSIIAGAESQGGRAIAQSASAPMFRRREEGSETQHIYSMIRHHQHWQYDDSRAVPSHHHCLRMIAAE